MHNATVSKATPRAGARNACDACDGCNGYRACAARTGRKNARKQNAHKRTNTHKRPNKKRVNENPGNKGFITDSIDRGISGNASRRDAFDTSVQNGIDDNPATMRRAARQKL
jgi:hypothetical protein